MNKSLYIARQPILDMNENIFAYELLYRDTLQSSNIKNDRHATVTVLSNVLNKFGVKSLLSKYKAFIKTDKKFLLHDVIFCIPKEHFIFSIGANIDFSELVEQRIIKLHEMGYTLAINDVLLSIDIIDKFFSILKYISYFKVDINTLASAVEKLKQYHIKTIFTKVETYEMFEKAKSLNGDFVQGYFFSKPKVLQQENFDPNSLKTINLCNFIMSDASIDDIVDEFENNHAMSLQLLKFINSGSFYFRNKISSIRQILTLMGRTPLTEWLMLMVYSTNLLDEDSETETPLLNLLQNRTNLMVAVSKQIENSNIQDLTSKVYFLGVISLLDSLCNVKMETILEELSIDNEIKDALVSEESILGEIYMFTKNIETFNAKGVETFCNKYHIKIDKLKKLTFDVLQSATEFKSSKSK
ncbi:EAL and HDOD domain-containing protein [Sulfurimonas sp.]|uniref:EAL and HDOD domain-containing protein n=1 Tax=Sulfurimonas sp. TaxID=2022749 RepID=UPI002B49D52B|nr:HDOD domain-containing protein [Sulfurimonas sp.]